jgi:GntR family transcriptional regulator, rspAB operon transcriptional repressor
MVSALPSPNGFQRPQRLSDHAYEHLKALIVSNTLRPGEALTEERFASQWNISRTPLRAALARLERDGLVRVLPHKGCVVTEITPHDVESVYQIREALEAMAVQLATPRIPDDKFAEIVQVFEEIERELSRGSYEKYIPSDAMFHAAILEFVPNLRLTRMLNGIYDEITRIRNFSHAQPGEHMHEAFREHVRILTAMQRRDAEEASIATRDHLRNVTRRAILLLDHPVASTDEPS